MRLELVVWVLPKLPNTLLGAPWFVRSSHAKKWKALVAQAMLLPVSMTPEFLKRVPLATARIALTRHSPRQSDFDGMVGSFKPVLDALVYLGVIEDDTPAHVECSYEWVKTPGKKQRIGIVVEGG